MTKRFDADSSEMGHSNGEIWNDGRGSTEETALGLFEHECKPPNPPKWAGWGETIRNMSMMAQKDASEMLATIRTFTHRLIAFLLHQRPA
jgi:hypothetical protein